jgi:uncharacterized protein (DUF2164 family)
LAGVVELPLSDETKKRAVHEMRVYLQEEHDLELGRLGAELLLERLMALVGPAIYNHAVTDVQAWLQAKLADLDSDLFRPEPPAESR